MHLPRSHNWTPHVKCFHFLASGDHPFFRFLREASKENVFLFQRSEASHAFAVRLWMYVCRFCVCMAFVSHSQGIRSYSIRVADNILVIICYSCDNGCTDAAWHGSWSCIYARPFKQSQCHEHHSSSHGFMNNDVPGIILQRDDLPQNTDSLWSASFSQMDSPKLVRYLIEELHKVDSTQ